MGLILGSVSQNSARLRAYIYWWDASPSQDWKILNNKTKIRAIPLIDTSNDSYDWNGTVANMLMNINSSIKNNYGSFNSDTTGGWTYTAANSPTGRIAENILTAVAPYYEIDVPHNEDGTKPNCVIACSFSLPSGGYGPGNAVVSGSVALTSIPRASEVTVPAGNIGEAVSININKYSSGFTSTLRYECGALSDVIVEKTLQTSWGWIIPTSFFALIPNAKTVTCKVTCETFNGGISLGIKETTFQANVNQLTSAPEVSAVIIDDNVKTVGLTGDSSKMVKYASNAKATITATAKNIATLTTKRFDCLDGKTGTGSPVILNAVEKGDFTVIGIDSRGISTAVPYTKTLIEYIKLTANANFRRNTMTDNKVKLSFNGNYYNDTFGAIANTLSVKYRYKLKTSEVWSVLYTLTPVISGNTYSGTDIILAPGGVETVFDYGESYDFELYAYDKIYDITGIRFPQTVAPGKPVFAPGKNFFDIYAKTYMDVGGGALALLSGSTADHVFMEWYARSASPTVRSAYMGFPNAGTDNFRIVNERSGGNVELLTAGGVGSFLFNGKKIIPVGEDHVQPISFNKFGITSNTVLTTSYPQELPLTKIMGDLVVSSGRIVLPKGYIYDFEFTIYGTGAGWATMTFYDTSNNRKTQSCMSASVTGTSGITPAPASDVLDLTDASVDLTIKFVNNSLNGALTAFGYTASQGYIKITKYKKATV